MLNKGNQSVFNELLTEKGCEKIEWQAVPFTAPSEQRVSQFKRLEAFYKSCGGTILTYTNYRDNSPISATMEYSIPKIV